MELVKDRDMAVFHAKPYQMREFIEHHEVFHLLECTSFVLVAGYLAMCQTLMVDWRALGCVV